MTDNIQPESGEIKNETSPRKKSEFRVSVVTVIVAVVLTIVITALASFAVFYKALANERQNLGFLRKVQQLDAIYRSMFVGELDYDKITDALLDSYIYVTDKYGYYLSKSEYAEMVNTLNSSNVGMGVYITRRENGAEVLLVMKDSPAERAGLQQGDVIFRVNDNAYSEMEYNDFVAACRGEEGETGTIWFYRGGETLSAEIVYSNYYIQTIVSKNLGNGVGYIYIISFESKTANDFKSAIDALKSEGCDKFIFDVRNNGGGLLDSTVEMLDYIMGEGVIVTETDGSGVVTKSFSSDANDAIEGMKCAVLINGGSASASELFSCALRDSRGALLVGENSYGKGTMQLIVPLGDGSGVGVTTHYFNPPVTPNFDGIGLKPDIEVALPDEALHYSLFNMPYVLDTQLKAAVEAVAAAD